jgi:diguanylate cyclase (GGDEF)-like protein
LVRQTRVKLDEDVGIELMVSIGVASQAKIDSGKDALEDLLAKADEAMYRAKESGRDRVAVSE